MSVSASIPDTSLGLTFSEIQILRQQQQIALQGGHNAGTGISRGRGTGRTSNSSSRAASAASSHGRLLLDPMSLRALSQQLDVLQTQIQNRLDYVCFFLSFLFFFFVLNFTTPTSSTPSTASYICQKKERSCGAYCPCISHYHIRANLTSVLQCSNTK